ncbi:GNAT family N-acetyltransferase [Streptomyces sp. UNOC14_S4]|uniref:GNAT family N-acetyltransferase n=1 Tax=Streptomyces sp. UNOC14_S4 TaxID=2872340 RepID=UPI001E33E6BD|nr:GNAT family N-acetyltransferase [Streptomyces sp. UNOC14_S4]MCC3770341.1 GNAT family N-acetyltransferase [Streptomyces sp. UNOC14_S4]
MTLTFVRDPELTPVLRAELLDLWVDVSQAGGAVGFVPPVTADEVRPMADAQLARVAGGRMRMLGAYEEGRLVGTTFLGLNEHHLMAHWCTLFTVMIHPSLQGGGRGRRLLGEAVGMARDLGFDALRLGVRGGMGTEDFYASCGFKEVGRVPRGIRVGPGDERDDITMWLPLN